MFLKLRYIFLLFAAGCLLWACESDTPNVNGSEMQFAVGNLSRAVTNSDNITNSSISMFAEKKFGEYDPVVIFDNTEVAHDGLGWKYANTQYWLPGHEYSFVAVHPRPVLSKPGANAVYSNPSLTFTHTISSTGEVVNLQDLDDIIVATHRRSIAEHLDGVLTDKEKNAVSLNFFHALSRIDFQVKNDAAADILKVTKIELEGVNKTGTFTVSPAPLLPGSKQTDDYDSSWTGISNIGNLTANIEVNISENSTSSLFPANNSLFMIPQPDNNDIIMKITYTLIDSGVDDVQVTSTSKAPIGGWQPGKVYTYSLAIEELSKEVTLTVSVKPWQTPRGAGITVPES